VPNGLVGFKRRRSPSRVAGCNWRVADPFIARDR
jgi:hypothetical protein